MRRLLLVLLSLFSANLKAAPRFSPVQEWCINQAVSIYFPQVTQLSQQGFIDLIHAIMAVEYGCGVKHVNPNLSEDYGCMQINSTHLPFLANYGIGPAVLQHNDCQNIVIGTWVMTIELRKEPDLWTAIGNYNSHTPYYNQAYRVKVWRELQKIWAERQANHLASR